MGPAIGPLVGLKDMLTTCPSPRGFRGPHCTDGEAEAQGGEATNTDMGPEPSARRGFKCLGRGQGCGHHQAPQPPPHQSRNSLPRPWAGRSAPGPGHGRQLLGPPGAPRSVCSGARWRCAGQSGLGRGVGTVTAGRDWTRLQRGGVQNVEIRRGAAGPGLDRLHPRAANGPPDTVRMWDL